MHLAGCTPTPSAPWVTQRGRQLTWTLAERAEHVRFLIRDRDQKFTQRFDEVFRDDEIEIVSQEGHQEDFSALRFKIVGL